MLRKSASLLFVLGCLAPEMAAALGLGELTLHSYLNEPLKAEVDLLATAGLAADQIKVRLASREDFARAGVERQYFLTNLKFELEFKEDGSSRLLLASTDRVREPFLDFLVEARWPHGRILREYTVLLDPPLLSGPGSGVLASATVGGAAVVSARGDRYSSIAAAMPTAGAEYRVQRDETLWSIAGRARPAGTTIQQTMLAIQRLNPQAFIANNINQLKAGYLLRLPSSSDISDRDFAEAVAEVAQQQANWLEADGSGTTGSDEDQGRLHIAGVDGDLRAGMENLDRVQRENSDLMVRVGAMEEQVDTFKRLVAFKDDQISALQSALASNLDGTAVPAQQLAIIGSATDELSNALDANLADAGIDTAADVSPAPAMAGLAMDYLLYIVAVLALLLAGVGWLLRDKLKLPRLSGRPGASREQAGAAHVDDEFAGVELVADDDLIVDEFMDDAKDGAAPIETVSSFSAPDEETYAAQFETADALAEADIYMAYGRFPQAVDLLKTAIAIEPYNTEYRIKLMEACIEMVASEEFQQQFADLQVIDDDAALQRARALLDAVDGGEVWLEDLPKPSLTAADVAVAEPGPEPASAATALPAEGGFELVGFHDYGLNSDDALEAEEEEGLVFASDGDQVATKLDLARAYLDMGDYEGARSILEEVQQDGSASQQQEAQLLLDNIA